MAVAEQRRRCRDLLFIQRRAGAFVGGFTGGILLELAEKTLPAGDNERDHHAVAFADIFYRAAGFHHFPHKLMAENVAVMHLRDFAAIEV